MMTSASTSLYRSIWRWHSWAGIVVLPVLAWMAVTGALYLYEPELERTLYRDWIVTGSAAPAQSIGALIERVEAQSGGKVTQVSAPAAEGESWRMTVEGREGPRLAFVRPDTGEIVGTAEAGGPLDIIKRLHSLTVAGTIGNAIVEIVAGWAILLVLTGAYLRWPRRGNHLLSLAGRTSERRFWRNLHASTGVLAGGVLLFLAVTGMPWTVFWGAQFHGVVAREQIGRPPPPAEAAKTGRHDAHLPWSLQGAAAPVAERGVPIGPDRALAAAARQGLGRPWILDLPAAPGATYRISAAAERTSEIRLIHVDPSNGSILQDVGFADFGPGAKAFEWGIYTHQGQQYGEANRLLMLFGCIGVLILAGSAPVMWRKRRRDGGGVSLGRSVDRRSSRGAVAIMLVVGALFPLTGLTMLAAFLASRLARLRTAGAD